MTMKGVSTYINTSYWRLQDVEKNDYQCQAENYLIILFLTKKKKSHTLQLLEWHIRNEKAAQLTIVGKKRAATKR